MITIKHIQLNDYQFFYDQNLTVLTTFLQSPLWGKFQDNLGYPTIQLGIYQGNQLQTIAQVIKIKAKRGNFLFLPHGPIFDVKSPKLKIKNCLKTLTKYLTQIAKKESFDFIRIAPILENTFENQKIFQDLGFKKAPIYIHAETTWVLSLDKTEEELLSQMRKTTRYLIRKIKKQGVIIEKRTDNKAVDDFYKIYQQTAQREKFTPFSYDYLKKEFEAFQKTGDALFFFAKLKEKNSQSEILNSKQTQNSDTQSSKQKNCHPELKSYYSKSKGCHPELDSGSQKQILINESYLASSLIIFNKNCAFYHQGASIHTKIPVTYLLQWEAIKEAKKRGCQYYNFWGVYDEKSKRTPKSWQGLTLFKTGFGGQLIRYLPTQDYIVSPKYYLTYLWEKFLGWKRDFKIKKPLPILFSLTIKLRTFQRITLIFFGILTFRPIIV